ncbi:unnamed protein product [Owenia fusiformis]|uniref:Uncharacterized protein n=1 Tax=Owenia fusiformis TaxID=6347 RepID=A0A8J1UBI5_OWEFU|nr:unnamed protein product [Owenia fusiformis]
MSKVWCLVFLIGVSTRLSIGDERRETKAVFSQWMTEYNKVYRDNNELLARYETFKKNLDLVERLNVEHNPTEFVMNQFGDMTQSEFKSKILMPPRSAPVFENDRYLDEFGLKDTNIPDAFDWRIKNMVTSVKDQGSGGTCWAFSTIGNLEGQWAMQGKPLTNLSVEQVVDCDSMKDPLHHNADCGVFGGWPYLAYQYVQHAGGIETEEDYPYCCGIGGGPGSCFVCQAVGYNKTLCGPPVPWCNVTCADKINPSKFVPGLKVVGWNAIPKNESEIAIELVKTGPLSVALHAELLQFYHKGVFDPPKELCDPKNLDHAVLLVGYGTEKTIFGEKPYWIVKNSWGIKWGQQGYFWIRRGKGVCGINTSVTTARLQQ